MGSFGSCPTQFFYMVPVRHTPFYTYSPSTGLCTKVGVPVTGTSWASVIFFIQGVLLRATAPRVIPPLPTSPYCSPRSGYLFVSIHAPVLIPISYYFEFPDTGPEVASGYPVSVAKHKICPPGELFAHDAQRQKFWERRRRKREKAESGRERSPQRAK